MDQAQGWLPDPEHEGEERYWSGSAWTDRVRPAGKAVILHLPEHLPELQRALAAATMDIDAVEDRLSTLFDRQVKPGQAPPRRAPARPVSGGEDEDEAQDGDFDYELYLDFEVDDADDAAWPDDCGSAARLVEVGRRECDRSDADADADADEHFAELDAALAAELPEHLVDAPDASSGNTRSKRSLFRRRS
jgi:Protein of unknown function (DUF2510)